MKRVFSAVTAVVILASCVNEEALTVDSQPSEDVVASGNVEGMAYVKFDQDMARMIEEDMADGDLVTRSAGLNLSLESLGIRSVERVFSDGGEFEARRRAAGLHLWYVVTYDPSIPHTETGRIHGYTGVNIVNGEYEQEGRRLILKGLGVTMMAGPEEDMNLERNILDAFNDTMTAKMAEDGSLEFLNGDGDVIMTLSKR